MKHLKLLLFSLVFLLLPSWAHAANLNIDCPTPPSGCTKTGLDPLFSTALDGIWYPGKVVNKTVNLRNSGSSAQDFAVQALRTSATSNIENVLQVSLFPSLGGPVTWAGTLAQFYAQEKIILGSFAPGTNQDYTITVSMDFGAGNEYQNQQTVFDLTAGFWIVPTPTPSSSSSSSSSGGGGGGSTPVCNDTTPGGAPTLLSATASGPNSVTLTWSPAANPVTYYLVAYGIAPGTYIYGNPNVGGSSTTSYAVSGLSGGVTYYFVVRAGNGCAPGPFSNQLSATPGGGVIAGPATDFTEGVLGVTTPPEPTPTPTATLGEVAGEQAPGLPVCWWWLILSILATLIVSVTYKLWGKKNKPKFWWILSLVIGPLAWAGDHFISHRYFTPSVWCEWMWLWSSLAVGIPSVIYYQKTKPTPEETAIPLN